MAGSLRINSNSTDAELLDVITRIKGRYPREPAVAADLARSVASSGAQISARASFSADVASTGGPTSLSTLICPLFLRAAGAVVPKLGVPGRPAGGIDCLAQIPAYQYRMNKEEVEQGLDSSGYVHFLVEDVAPLDIRMFRLRQQNSAQDVPTLVAASLMAKKLAVGVNQAGLDVRVAPHGNFGKTWKDAKENAHLFIDTGRRLGITTAPVLTDGCIPYQPYVGRKEALLALYKLFDGQQTAWLGEHFALCRTIALSCAPPDRRPQILHTSPADLKKIFEQNVQIQGGQMESLPKLMNQVEADHRLTINAKQDGFASFNLEGIRHVLVDRQRRHINTTWEFPDPLGLIFKARPGEWVKAGACLATVRVQDQTDLDALNDLAPTFVGVQQVPVGLGVEGVLA